MKGMNSVVATAAMRMNYPHAANTTSRHVLLKTAGKYGGGGGGKTTTTTLLSPNLYPKNRKKQKAKSAAIDNLGHLGIFRYLHSQHCRLFI